MGKTRSQKIAKRFRKEHLRKRTQAELKFKEILVRNKIPFQEEFIVRFKEKKGFYIIDFWLQGKNIGIEIDGEYHKNREAQDELRTMEIQSYTGIAIKRYTNKEVLCYPDKVEIDLLNTLRVGTIPWKKATREQLETLRRKKIRHKKKLIKDKYIKQKNYDGTILGFYL